ncbi:hypothetical protein ABEW34_21685 [Paenibacillus algorifonticola]|uniref:hypothetical protein n=1 Tax=Paenibacillus algorifonticola TaxID=684063 RepID=UPI003D278154
MLKELEGMGYKNVKFQRRDLSFEYYTSDGWEIRVELDANRRGEREVAERRPGNEDWDDVIS